MHELTHETTPAADWERLRPVIDEALHSLDERDREAVLLRFFEGRAFAEVGQNLRLSEEAARKRVERALEKMQAALAQRGVRSTAAALGLALAGQAGVAAPAGLAASATTAALAAAGAAGAGGVAAAVSFMTITKITAGLAAVMALGAVGAGVFEVGQAREPKAVVAAAAPVASESEPLRRRSEDLVASGRGVEDIAREVTARDRELERTNAWLKDVQAKPGPAAKEEPMSALPVAAPAPSPEPKPSETKPAAEEKETVTGRVTVTGAVNRPGEVLFQKKDGLTLIGAISRAGSFTRMADKKRVSIKRTSADGTVTVTINAVDEMMKGAWGENYPLQAGDVIFVRENAR